MGFITPRSSVRVRPPPLDWRSIGLLWRKTEGSTAQQFDDFKAGIDKSSPKDDDFDDAGDILDAEDDILDAQDDIRIDDGIELFHSK